MAEERIMKKNIIQNSTYRLYLKATEECCQELCPMKIEKLISNITYTTGNKYDSVKEHLKILSDCDIINVDKETTEVRYIKKGSPRNVS